MKASRICRVFGEIQNYATLYVLLVNKKIEIDIVARYTSGRYILDRQRGSNMIEK